MNRVPLALRVQIINCLVEGNSIRPTERMIGTHCDTICRLLVVCGDTDRSVANLLDHLRDETTDENPLKALLGRFLMRGLMCEDDGTFLSLALPKQQGL
jgi:hypothetical protein